MDSEAVVISAMVAALGYLAKLAISGVAGYRRRRRERRAALIRLSGLLKATHVSFIIQNERAEELLRSLRDKHADLVAGKGYEETFELLYDRMSPLERELHGLIRSITMYAMYPNNVAVMRWIADDTYFKSFYGRSDGYGRLADQLDDLHSHLILWKAKYEYWIPNVPNHALVYMNDEKRHGLGFPDGVDDALAAVLRLY